MRLTDSYQWLQRRWKTRIGLRNFPTEYVGNRRAWDIQGIFMTIMGISSQNRWPLQKNFTFVDSVLLIPKAQLLTECASHVFSPKLYQNSPT